MVSLVVVVLWTAGMGKGLLSFAAESFTGSLLDVSLGLPLVTITDMELAMISLATPFFDAPMG